MCLHPSATQFPGRLQYHLRRPPALLMIEFVEDKHIHIVDNRKYANTGAWSAHADAKPVLRQY
jgi:hypothetical protein